MLATIQQVKAKGLDGENLVGELNIPAKPVAYEEEGFKYQPDLGISIQGQSATDAWKEVLMKKLLRRLGKVRIAVRVVR
jgi:hypothetical protein